VSFRDDYIMRLIKQVAEFLARIAGHDRKQDFAAAVSEAERAWSEVLGVPRELVDVLDSTALAKLLGDADKIRAAGQLLAAEARAVAGKGDPLGAGLRYRRALEMFCEARALDPTEPRSSSCRARCRRTPSTSATGRDARRYRLGPVN
jgi:hypothetical protein